MANSCSVSYSSEVEDEEEEIEVVDRVSDLPESILHDILYCLPMKEAALMSTLSKRWNCVQSSSPDFCFYVDEYLQERGLHDVDEHLVERDLTSSETERVDEFVVMVDHHLLKFSDQKNSLSMRDFHLVMYTTYDRRWSVLIDSWIKLALEKNVSTLCLFLSGPPEDPYSSTAPKFHHVMNRDLFGSCQEFGSLKELDLDGVDLSEEFIEDLVRSCPLISYLQITRCRGLKTLRVSQLTSLESFLLVETSPELALIHIDAPSLEYAYVSQDYEVMFPCLYDLDSCESLVTLHLTGGITNTSLELFISRFRHLEVLRLYYNESERISISSPTLKHVELWYCNKLVEADIHTPNLSTFVYARDNIDTFPRLCSENSRCVWELTLYLSGRYPIYTLWFSKLRELLGKSSHRKDIVILFYRDLKVTFDLTELGGDPLPCFPEVGCLRFDMVMLEPEEKLPCPSDFTALLDGLLWSCHPKTIFVEWDSNLGDEHKKLVAEKLFDRGDLCCCISNNVKCWKHFVKDVKIASFREVDGDRFIHDNRRKQPLYDLPIPSTIREIEFSLEWC